MSLSGLLLLALTLWGAFVPAHAASRLDEIRQRGHLTCGVAPKVDGFARVDPRGRVWGFEPDLCRAVAAAIFGGPDRVNFVAAASLKDFKRDSSIDLVARRLTLTLQRESDANVRFSPIVFYDGVALLVSAKSGWGDPVSLAGRRICVTRGSEAELALIGFFRGRRLPYRQVSTDTVRQAADALFAGRCDALAADMSEIAAERARRRGGVNSYAIMPALLSKEPLALLMHGDDEQFVQIVRWSIFTLIEAEELNIHAANLQQRRTSQDPGVADFFGAAASDGPRLGLSRTWAEDLIRSVGDYGELYDRNLGANSPIQLKRGLNALWTSGGLLYAPPLR